MNAARQAEITQEISEIVGGANALADSAAGSESEMTAQRLLRPGGWAASPASSVPSSTWSSPSTRCPRSTTR